MIDFVVSARHVARLFGADAAALTFEVAARFHPHDNCPTCGYPEILRQWAAPSPPVRRAR